MFGDPNKVLVAERRLQEMRQTASVSAYAAEFRKYQTRVEWDDTALASQFYRGLKDTVKDNIVRSDRPTTLQAMIDLAIKIDNRHLERAYERKGGKTFIPYKKTHDRVKRDDYGPRPMEVDMLSKDQDTVDNKSKKDKKCFNCGKAGHFAKECRGKKGKGRPFKKPSYNQKKKDQTVYKTVHMIEYAENSGEDEDITEWELPDIEPTAEETEEDSDEELTKYCEKIAGEIDKEWLEEVEKETKYWEQVRETTDDQGKKSKVYKGARWDYEKTEDSDGKRKFRAVMRRVPTPGTQPGGNKWETFAEMEGDNENYDLRTFTKGKEDLEMPAYQDVTGAKEALKREKWEDSAIADEETQWYYELWTRDTTWKRHSHQHHFFCKDEKCTTHGEYGKKGLGKKPACNSSKWSMCYNDDCDEHLRLKIRYRWWPQPPINTCERLWNACRDDECETHLPDKRAMQLFPGLLAKQRQKEFQGQSTDECNVGQWECCFAPKCWGHFIQKVRAGYMPEYLPPSKNF